MDSENNLGVFHFKQGMGGEEMTSPGPFEYYSDGLKRVRVVRRFRARRRNEI